MCNSAVKTRKQATIYKDKHLVATIGTKTSRTVIFLLGDILGKLPITPYGEFTHFPKNVLHDSRTFLLGDMLGILVISHTGNSIISPRIIRRTLKPPYLGKCWEFVIYPIRGKPRFPVFSPDEYGENFGFTVFSRGFLSPYKVSHIL